MDVSGQQIPWHTDTITLHNALNTDLGFKIVTTDNNGRTPNIKFTVNNTDGGYYDPTTGKFIWTKPAKAGTYTLRLSAYSATDIADSQAGVISIVIDGAPVSSGSSSHKKKFLGGMDLVMLVLLVGSGLRRRLSNNWH